MKVIPVRTDDKNPSARSMGKSVATRVLGYTIFGSLMISRHKSELTITIVSQPKVIQVVAQPFAPFALQRHTAPNRNDGECEASRNKRHKTQRLRPELRSIFPLDCVKEITIPEIQSVLNQQLQEHSGNQQCNQEPCAPRLRTPPESGSALPEAKDEALLIRNDVSLLRHQLLLGNTGSNARMVPIVKQPFRIFFRYRP